MDILILITSLFLLYKKKLAWVLFGLILLSTSYLNAGTNFSEFPFLHNVSDAGLILYLALSFYLLKKNKFKARKTPLSKYIMFFFLFLLVSIVVDLVFNGIDLLSIVKTSRHWIFLSCIWIFPYIPEEDVKKLIKYLLNALAIAALITIIDYFFNVKLLGKEVNTEYLVSGFLVERGSIPSILILFFIVVLFTSYFKFKQSIKYFYIGIFSAVIITSMIRSWFLAMVIGILLALILQDKLKFKKQFIGIVIAAGLIFIVYNNPIIQQRFGAGLEEILEFNLAGNVQGNLSFRILLLVERINYIFQNFQHTIFGIGNVTEYNFPNIFVIGLRDLSGRVTQLDTADIAWSSLLIRIGFLGIIIYLIYYVKVLYTFYLKRFQNPLALTMFIYLLLNLTLISFTSSDIAAGQFWLLPILVYYKIKKTA